MSVPALFLAVLAVIGGMALLILVQSLLTAAAVRRWRAREGRR